MSDEKLTLEEMMSSLKRERDELKLQMHLAGMEAKDEYERLSGKLDELTTQFDPVKDAVSESADNVWAAMLLAADEMKSGFTRIRKSLSE